VGLVLFSDHRLSQPLGFVNGKKKKSFDYFLGRKTGRKAYTHNTVFGLIRISPCSSQKPYPMRVALVSVSQQCGHRASPFRFA
jgi:hypothetical protein